MVPMFLWIPMDSYGFLWIPMLWKWYGFPMDSYGFLWWFPMVSYGFLWIPMISYGSLWFPYLGEPYENIWKTLQKQKNTTSDQAPHTTGGGAGTIPWEATENITKT